MTVNVDVDSADGVPRPAWARRLRTEREARGWSQAQTVRVLRAHADTTLPSDATLLRNWKRWESGRSEPDDFYQALIARAFGTVTGAFLPVPSTRDSAALLLAGTGMDTLELLARLRASDVSAATLEALRITTDRLCCEYPHRGAARLQVDGHAWLARITGLLSGRRTLAQHREILSLAGMVALLLGCVEHDLGRHRAAEATRTAAMSLGVEAGTADVVGWAYELRAWYALTHGDYRAVLAAASAGEAAAAGHGVAVQLAAQRAKAWARLGDRRQVEVALDQGRTRLEALTYPPDTDHHFVVDPAKFDFYAMDCYRVAGEDRLARLYADEVIRAGTAPDGRQRNPMRTAEARITLAVLAARRGDLEQALGQARQALNIDRRSLPSLLLPARELAGVLTDRYPGEPQALGWRDEVRALAQPADFVGDQ